MQTIRIIAGFAKIEYTEDMPKVFEINGYKFFFFSNEGIPLEQCHIQKIREAWNAFFIG